MHDERECAHGRPLGKLPNNNPKPRDTAHGAISFVSPHRDSLRDGFRISAATNSSGQSAGCDFLLIAQEKSTSTASLQLLSARRTMASGSATLAIPGS